MGLLATVSAELRKPIGGSSLQARTARAISAW
jgi:hypothetical protein